MDFFDDIICINMKHRDDRREHMRMMMKQLDIPFRFYLAERNPKGGIYGCFESHINVIKQCYDTGCKHIMIFEDDLIPTKEYSLQKIMLGIDFMKTHEWDIFYYGYIVIGEKYQTLLRSRPSDNSNIVAFRPFGTHAYCINRHTMETVLSNYHLYIGKMHLDHYYCMMMFRAYCIVPMLFDQQLCMTSDIEAANTLEHIARQHMCIAQKHEINYRVSWIVWFINKYYYAILTVISIICVFVIIMVCVLLHLKRS